MAREADVARGPARMQRGTQGHVAEPREPTCRLGDAKEARTRGRGHTSPHGRLRGRHVVRGGWHLKGPLVSGPWLGVWGSNANAFSRPTFYTRYSLPFLPCGTMFPGKFVFAGHVAASQMLDVNHIT